MSLEDVSVSLSRLALAKAIKTPDTDEIEAEPWSKSVIFHQSHITDDMKNSIMNPQSIKKGRKYMPKQPKPSPQYPQQLYPQQQQLQQQPYPQQHHLPAPMNRTRSSDRPQSSSSSSISSNNKSSVIMHSAITKNNRRFVPSDDEEEEEEEDEEESESEGEEQEPKTVINRQPQTPKPDMKPLSTTSTSTGAPKLDINIPPPEIVIGNSNNKEKGKVPKRTIQPSDDEDSEEEEEEEQDDDEEEEEEEEEKVEKVEHKEHEQHMYERRMSTLKQLERGPSVHRRARSTGDVIQEVQQQQQQQHPIEQWRMSVLDVDTPGSTVSSTTPSDDLIEEPVFRISTPSSANYPRSVSEMDMYNTYLQQQQQMAYNMQMQHMMQMAQAQQMAQMAQFQQYQQAMQLQQQQQQQQQQQKQKNRKSVSAMDLMMQLEEEKAATRKNRKKIPDPSKANFADGFLSKLPEQGTHNINFQQMQQHHQHHQMTRASKSDYNVNKLRPVGQNAMGQRPSSTLMYYDPRMTMMRSESSPIPTISMSTPIQQQQQQQQFMPMMQQQNRSNQHLHQQQKRTSTYNLYK
ncbi:hypothetical protein RMATCC62417_18156 [Rhizopus microsporus]|nr:hypothetical protein RMATCC62417_18156 [Rhizopus microsporus]